MSVPAVAFLQILHAAFDNRAIYTEQRVAMRFVAETFRVSTENHRLSAATARQYQCMLATRIRQHTRAHRQVLLTFAEALSEALYLFQCRSSLPKAGSTVNHCLVFSLTEAHNMAIDWPYPLASASSDQVSFTQKLNTSLSLACSDFICCQNSKTPATYALPSSHVKQDLCRLLNVAASQHSVHFCQMLLTRSAGP